MLNRAKLEEWLTLVSDSLNEQQWYQELKGKWDELDQQSKTYVKLGLAICCALSIFFVILSSMWKVHSLKSDLEEKSGLISFIQNSSDEIRRIKENLPNGAAGGKEDTGPWLNYFQGLAAEIGIQAEQLTLASEKQGQSNEYSKEALIELKVKQTNIKKLAKLASTLESGRRPVKLRNLEVDTNDDPEGYVGATLHLSAFTPVSTPEK